MEIKTKSQDGAEQEYQPESYKPVETLELTLTITDPGSVRYLNEYSGQIREEKALEALRVGVIALQSASPSLDTRLVEEKFREVNEMIGKQISEFEKSLQDQMKSTFNRENGSLPATLDGFLGKNGQLIRTMEIYFSRNGMVQDLINQLVGPGSNFSRSIDPANREGVLARVETLVRTMLEEKVTHLVNEFSLDLDHSALSRLQRAMFEKVDAIQEGNNRFFVELKEQFGIIKGRAEEAEKGTNKGRKFEDKLYDWVAKKAKDLEDESESVGSQVGVTPYSKKGDYLLTLGENSGLPGARIVMEAKNDQSYNLRRAIEELNEAKINRNATMGIFIWNRGCEPAGQGDFHRVGNDFFVTVDEEALDAGKPLLFLETAYKIIRTLLITSARKLEAEELNLEAIKAELNAVIKLTEELSLVKTKTSTILKNAQWIEETAEKMKSDLDQKLKGILEML